ncbi:hypothetical protein [Brevibacillus centrosporus]|nr:hypothetical protein [Brevibacillus centrosporus]MEC2127925.1 hypothetical protein [Brevibacillus centrosporus]GED32830.1 hypothetical protein BCE02nite_39710 [Brevibacillus centrosporus]
MVERYDANEGAEREQGANRETFSGSDCLITVTRRPTMNKI